MDPGPGLRFDLYTSTAIAITTLGTNLLNDGGTYGGTPTPNLVGSGNGTCEVWIAAGQSVTNNALFTGNTYSHLPPSPPIAPWTLLSSSSSHINNFTFAPPDSPSLAAFNPPLGLPAGNYAVVLVFVPRGVASIPPGQGTPADPLTSRIHPLYTNLNSVPTPSTLSDGTITLTNIGIQNTAFSATAFSDISIPPSLPNVSIAYVTSPAPTWAYAYSTPYGLGCNATSQTFLESWPDGAMDIDASGTINGIDMFVIDESLNTGRLGDGYYWVTLNHTPGLWLAPGSSIGARRLNASPAGLGQGWDDAATPVGIPFTFPHPNNIQPGCTVIWPSSNGIIFLEDPARSLAPSSPLSAFSGDHSAFFRGPSAIAAAWTDFAPSSPGSASGDVWYDSDGFSFACVTWVNCEERGQPSQRSTVQVVIDAGGHVRIRFGSGGVQTTSHAVLTGYSAGRGQDIRSSTAPPRSDPDFSTACLPNGFRSPRRTTEPATVFLDAPPVIHRPMTLSTTIAYPASVLNITLLSTASLTPGLDLGSIGMPGCLALIQLPEIASFVSSNIAGRARWPVSASLPGFLFGMNLHAQSVQLCFNDPEVNASGILLSNALCIQVGNY